MGVKKFVVMLENGVQELLTPDSVTAEGVTLDSVTKECLAQDVL
jgi:hypothetical protein